MKLKTTLLTTLLSATLSLSVFANIGLVIDGNTVQTETSPFIEDGRTFVPVRVVTENLGADVTWDSESRTVGIQKDDTLINLIIDNDIATLNGEESVLDVAPKIVNGSTYVPIRFIAESFLCDVSWDAENQIVSIATETEDNSLQTQINPDIIETIINNQDTELEEENEIDEVEEIEEAITTQAISSQTNSSVVYITKSGKKYHFDNSCNSGTYFEPDYEYTFDEDRNLLKNETVILEPCTKCVL